jgi:TfoX/Sxy family transcriptional regulator of competence genes
MAYDPGLAQTLRDALSDLPITEKKMFGGLAFLLHGHMVCGVHKGGAMMRVGKDHYAKALTLQGVTPMMFTGKPMVAMVDVADASVEDDGIRGQLLAMALATVRALPPKVAKPAKR